MGSHTHTMDLTMLSSTESNNLSCPICIETLCEPLRTECGHVFCRVCIYQSTVISPDGRCCPLCREKITVIDDHGQLLPTSEDLEKQVLAKVEPVEYARRCEEARARYKELQQRASSKLPIFYMQPGCALGQPVKLHLFEARYKVLIRRAMEGNKTFLWAPQRPSAGMKCMLVQVHQAAFAADGKAG